VDSALGFGSCDLSSVPYVCMTLRFLPCSIRIVTLKRRPSRGVTFSMVHVGASIKSPNDMPWALLGQIDSAGQLLHYS